MPDPQIFKATYSGIPVYEMMCKGVAVMRRRSDSWLNATQILKVAGFDKPQRTRILEREVQKGEHEKVQGGYGKYQGTWIPLERGLTIAQQYNCEPLLRPIIDFQPTTKSPPPAPKHLLAVPAPKSVARTDSLGGPTTRSSRRVNDDAIEDATEPTHSPRPTDDGSMTPSPSEASSSSRTPSPIRSSPLPHSNGRSPSPAAARKGKRRVERYDEESASDDGAHRTNGDLTDPSTYGDQILEYFISDTNQIPQILINAPPDFDPNVAIDDDGHTALHWAAAMGRIRVVKLLLTAGADIFKVNRAGQTALMRSVMFANNYDVRKFPELYELLHRSTLNIDNFNRTVFHHIVDVAMSKQKTHAARYYMETVLGRLADYPKELADVINFQDEDGETALTMAARCRSKRLVKLLIDHGADPKIANNDNKTTEDYILEDERFRMSPGPPLRPSPPSHLGTQLSYASGSSSNPAMASARGLHHSAAAQKAATRCVHDMASMFDGLAQSFDKELRDKDRDTTQAHALLTNIQGEILESQRAVAQLKTRANGLEEAKQRQRELEAELMAVMGQRHRLGWEKWVKDEEERERAIIAATGGVLDQPVVMLPAPEPSEDGMGMNVKKENDVKTEPEISDVARGKRKAEPQLEDVSDLAQLHMNVPQDGEAIRLECAKLREEVMESRKRRRTAFEQIVRYQGEAGTQGRMGDYRRLIGAGCGIAPNDVDNVLGLLLEALESEEPATSSISPWTSNATMPRHGSHLPVA